MKTITGYQLVDVQTKAILKEYGPTQRNAAARRADKLDLEYGAVRYIVRPVYSVEVSP